VNAAPAITSAPSAIAVEGDSFNFTVQSNGNPNPALSETGSLPSGLTFTDNGDGTATIGGTPDPGSSGSYPLTITATNGVGSDAVQSFNLQVNLNRIDLQCGEHLGHGRHRLQLRGAVEWGARAGAERDGCSPERRHVRRQR